MCKRTVNRKMTMCKLAPELSVRREKNKNCYFANSNESHCSAANTGKKGACAKVNEEKGLICMGTSFNSLNKCRAVCEVSTPLSKPACAQPSDCTGKTKKWYCVEDSVNIPETVWGECPITKSNNSCDETCNPNYGKICCTVSGGAISQNGHQSVSKSCTTIEKAKEMTGKSGGLMEDANGNLTCAFFAP